MKPIKYFIPVFLLIIYSCSTVSGPAVNKKNVYYPSPGQEKIPESKNGLTETQQKLVEAAYWAKGRKNVSVNGRKYASDCSGVICAIYYKAGIDLQKAYPQYTGNGVERIYKYLKDKGLIYRPDIPVPGDIIFWDNTYDKNNNGKADDYLTHIGMVVDSNNSGNVTYIHFDYLSGIIFAKMNILHPSDKNLNSGMRMASLGPTPDGRTRSGELYREAGRGWELAD